MYARRRGASYAAISSSAVRANAAMLVISLAFLFVLAYFVLLDYLLGQTVGMMIFDLRIISEGSAAGAKASVDIGFFQSLLRNIFLIPAVPFIFLWLVDPIFAIFNKNNQRLTELLSKTLVVERYQL